MASSTVMPSSTNSDLNSHHHNNNHPSPSPSSQMISDFTATTSDLQQRINVDGILCDVYPHPPPPPSADITLIDDAGAIESERKTVEDVWREIVAGKNDSKECKVEAPDEMMTLEDFLAKAGAGMEGDEEGQNQQEDDVKLEVVSAGMQMSDCSGGLFGFDHQLVQCSYAPQQVPEIDYGNGSGGGMKGVRGKRRGGPILEPLDKAAQQRQRRMIKNRESAARSRERKQAYQIELESLALKLEEENEQLLREKAERSKERLKQLMEKVVPVVEKRRPPRVLRRVRSIQW